MLLKNNLKNNLKTKQQLRDIFISGLIGSGKDILANHLMINHDYFKIRIAGTIKQVIQDVLCLPFNELEIQKRLKPEIRQFHHDVNKIMTKLDPYHYPIIKSLNRIKLISRRQSMEFENKINHYVIPDVRSIDEIHTFFVNNIDGIGVFLLRNHQEEYVDNSHWTNKKIFNDSKFLNICKLYENRIIIIDNSDNKFTTPEKDGNDTIKTQAEVDYPTLFKHFKDKIVKTDGKIESLINVFEEQFKNFR